MKLFAVLSLLGLATATYAYGDVPASSSATPSYTTECDDEPTPAPVYSTNGTCTAYAETCYVTVTGSNATAPYAAGTG
jgi:hypothetical protein